LTAACFDSDTWPTVSVVMPVRNEAPHLERAVASILSQEYPLPFDVCLAIAPSDDGTEAIAADIAEREPRVSAVPNPAGVTPAGLNAAIGATTGDVIVRVDGHAELSAGYIKRAVETMRRTGAVNVGGVQVARGDTAFERAVAAAMTSWMGTGGSRFHVGGLEGEVDTVYLGVFDRAAGAAVGWFDDSLIRNQDYELNIRLRAAGGTVWFDPQLRVGYRPRGSWRALAKQYYEYGWWKAVVLRRHPGSLRLRQLVPALLVPSLACTGVLAFRQRRWAAIPAGYLTIVTFGSPRSSGNGGVDRTVIVGSLAIMHVTWSLGFTAGLLGEGTRSFKRFRAR
jgi:glycosyltransferase involved in cell wall biosynthesis